MEGWGGAGLEGEGLWAELLGEEEWWVKLLGEEAEGGANADLDGNE